MRLRSHLILGAAAILIPAFVASALALNQVREEKREAGLRELRETVRATALLVDGEVQRSLGALTALSTSELLASENFAAFYSQAAVANQPPDVWTLLLDDQGKQVVNTGVPFGTPLPPASAAERVSEVLKTGRPYVSDLMTGPATGKLLTTIYVPARAATGRQFVLAQGFGADHWQRAALSTPGPSKWLVAVIDRNGRFISRSLQPAEMLGNSARPELVAAAAGATEGVLRHATLEGVESYDAFAHSRLTGWTVAIAAPVGTIDASAWRASAWLAGGVVLALGAATLAAFLLGQAFLRAVNRGSEAARALGIGERPAISRTAFKELNDLFAAMSEAGALLTAERRSREHLEEERALLLANEREGREAAQAQNAAKDRFLALLGHELRNPVAAVAGAAAVIKMRQPDGQKLDPFLDIITRQTAHLSHIIDDLLDVSRLVYGKMALKLEPVDLAHSVERCVQSMRLANPVDGARLAVRAESAWVNGDPVRLEQICCNLFSNALKFSPPEAQVDVSVAAQGGSAVLEVTDSGQGISDDLLHEVFEPFVQGPGLNGSLASGLGIGLSLVKQLVELHGGEVLVETRAQENRCTFRVLLPLVSAPLDAESPSTAPAASGPCKVLLVEDNPDAMQATATVLRLEGFEVVEATDGEMALLLADQSAPDVVVLDVGLPRMDGYQVAAAFRTRAGVKDVPLIALTGYGQEQDRQRAASAGFDVHLVKPVDPDVLCRTISEEMRRRTVVHQQA